VSDALVTGAAALLFAATFLFLGRVHPLLARVRDPRGIVSFGAGMSAAYVFVHLMPKLHAARRALVESVSMRLRFEGMAIYYLALVGFLVFYGLNGLRAYLKEAARDEGKAGLAFKLDVGGFATYVLVVAYLLVHHLEGSKVSTVLFAVPIVFHFLSVDHSLRTEHGATYDRIGRPLLAGMCIAGWGIGVLVALPQAAVAMVVAFVSGAIIMNNAIIELAAEREGRFLPFMVGGLVYGLMLLPLG
jgi:hypothetical protein